MRLFSKILSILFVLSVLFFLFAPSVKAQCACKSHCSGSEELVDLCTNPYKKYYCCKIHQPTNTPQPTPTKGSGALPTVRPPTATPAPCNLTNDCVGYCAGIPNCSASCINGFCVFTNPTINNSQCNTWGNWSGCISGQDACGGCAAQGYTCQTRFCTNPSNANLYQISCGCGQPPGSSGGGGGSNTTYLSLQLLDPNLNIITPPVHLYCPPTPIFSQTPKPTFPPYCYLGSPIPGMPGATNPPNTSPCPTQSFAKSDATQLLVPLLPVNKMSPMPTSKESRPTRVGVFLTPTTFLPSLASPPSKTKSSKKATTCPTAKTTINSKTATPGIRRFPQATAL